MLNYLLRKKQRNPNIGDIFIGIDSQGKEYLCLPTERQIKTKQGHDTNNIKTNKNKYLGPC